MKEAFQKFSIGIFGTVFGLTLSTSTLVVWLQIISLVAGLILTGLTCVSIYISIRRKIIAWREDDRKASLAERFKQIQEASDETTTL